MSIIMGHYNENLGIIMSIKQKHIRGPSPFIDITVNIVWPLPMDSQNSPSSSSSSQRIWKYDVAISYNDMETGSFYTILWNTLEKEGFRIRSWLDPSLETIEGSMIYIVVFSQRYAFSLSCLDELAVMFECMKVHGHKFLPIFFKIDPSRVKTWLAPFQTLLERPEFVILTRKIKDELLTK
ncbi:disease resistance protein RPS6-like [Prosopis cineraria]|uniref:disease resistance protein RPS6-like n=1 Tax=Prosopis cineraria TaxID=364024 RepID=UPI00240FD104|nr:disease resistance protein RPS6-like [Prosopis cineraria]